MGHAEEHSKLKGKKQETARKSNGPPGEELGRGQNRGRRGKIQNFFLFSFHISKPNQIQIKFEHGFQIHSPIQIKMKNISEFPKNKFNNFLNSFIFQIFFSFLLLQRHFQFHLQKHFKPLNQIHQMQGHVCTIMLLNLMMSFNSMKILFSYIS